MYGCTHPAWCRFKASQFPIFYKLPFSLYRRLHHCDVINVSYLYWKRSFIWAVGFGTVWMFLPPWCWCFTSFPVFPAGILQPTLYNPEFPQWVALPLSLPCLAAVQKVATTAPQTQQRRSLKAKLVWQTSASPKSQYTQLEQFNYPPRAQLPNKVLLMEQMSLRGCLPTFEYIE